MSYYILFLLPNSSLCFEFEIWYFKKAALFIILIFISHLSYKAGLIYLTCRTIAPLFFSAHYLALQSSSALLILELDLQHLSLLGLFCIQQVSCFKSILPSSAQASQPITSWGLR